MAFSIVTKLTGGLTITNRYEIRSLAEYIKKNRGKRMATPLLPWLIDLAFDECSSNFPTKEIEKILIDNKKSMVNT